MRLEYNFSNQHLELIRSSADTDFTFDPTPYHTGIMGSATGDYIRMSVLDEDGTFIRSFYSNLSKDDTEIIYTPGAETSYAAPNTVVIPNPSGDDFGLDPYPIYNGTESLDQYCADMGHGAASNPTFTTADVYYRYYDYGLATSPDAYWPLAGNADDAIGSLHGTATGTYNWVDDLERGSVMQFVLNGAAKVTVPATSDFNPSADDLTFVAWSKLDSGFDPTTELYNHMGIIGRYTDNNHFAILHYNHGNPAFYVRNGPDNAERVELFTATLGLLNDDQWHHFAGVIEGDTYRLYVDGVEATAPITKAGVHPDLSSDSIDIGNFGSQDSISGYMSDAAAWNRALAEEEISEIYTQGLQYWTLEQGSAQVAASVECIATVEPDGYSINWTTGDLVPQLKIYKDASNNLYVKPNEALEFGNINEGNYQLQFDFLHNPFYVFGSNNTEEKYYFYITEISPSRKEVRLIARDGTDQQISIDEDMIGELQPTGSYQYDFVLALSTGQNIPILNYMIDLVSDPLNSSLILKLYFPLPTEITRLANVTIEQEVITTQIENIWYKTEAYIESTYGYGLGNIIAEGGGLYNDI